MISSTGSCLSAVECRLVASMSLHFFARGLHTRTAVARLSLRQLGFLVLSANSTLYVYDPRWLRAAVTELVTIL